MRRFYTQRHKDVSGVSGVGKVAQGVVFDNGKVALSWTTDKSSTTIFDSLEDAIEIHGHQGSTEFIFIDPEEKQ